MLIHYPHKNKINKNYLIDDRNIILKKLEKVSDRLLLRFLYYI